MITFIDIVGKKRVNLLYLALLYYLLVINSGRRILETRRPTLLYCTRQLSAKSILRIAIRTVSTFNSHFQVGLGLDLNKLGPMTHL